MGKCYIGALGTRYLAALRSDLVARVVIGATFGRFALVPLHCGGPGREPSLLGVLVTPFQAVGRGPQLP